MKLNCTASLWTLTVVAAMAFAAAPMSPQRSKANSPHPATQTSAVLPQGAMQATATTVCTECHDSSIILQQRLSKAAWTKEVDKMTKWGASVDPKDHDPLIDYLSTNFSPDKPPYEPAKTAPQKNAK